MKILDLVDDVRSGCKSVLTTMTLILWMMC